jgi:hypothetical protein
VNANPDRPLPGRASAAAEKSRAQREKHGATNAANAARLIRFLKEFHEQEGDDAPLPNLQRIKDFLPRLVRAEAEEALAVAYRVKNDAEFRALMEKANVLRAWAEQCRFESTQEAALELVKLQRFTTM